MAWTCGLSALPAASLRLVMDHRVQDEPLKLDALSHANAAGETWSVTRLSYLLTEVALQREDGSWFEIQDAIAWMDAMKQRKELLLREVPTGKYQALRFHVGPSPADNASDPALRGPEHPLNPNVCGLHWSWQGGYIFMALEGFYRSGEGQAQGFSWHLARDPFRTAITLPVRFELRDETVLPVVLDLAQVMDGPQKISLRRDGATTHSRDGDPLAMALKTNLASAFRVQPEQVKAVAKTAGLSSKGAATQRGKQTPYRLSMGAAFPMPSLPEDNPLTEERVALGRRLFHEGDLSRDGQIRCASCHLESAALSDPRRFSVGVEGRLGDRQAMPLFNLAWKKEFFWDGRASSLRAQVLIPIQDHREMDETLDRVVTKLSARKEYPDAFERAFGTPEITPEKLSLALENYLLTLTSHEAKFDRAQRGLETLTAEEQRGFELFMMEREPRLGTLGADCFHCHGGALFTDHQFRNNGLAIRDDDLGRARVTRLGLDRGAFATPSLRNIALTAPYMHDGRFTTLEQVLDHYSEGVQRTDTLDPNLAKHPDGGLHLSAEDKKALIAFLHTLTDRRFTSTAAKVSQ